MDIQAQIKELQSQLDKLKAEVAEPKKLPYNAWYNGKSGSIVYFTKESSGYGHNNNGVWYDNDVWVNLNTPDYWHPCPHSEVEAIMIKEAEKRGFVKGVRFISVTGETCVCSTPFVLWGMNKKDLGNGGTGLICYNGQWAEIIKDEDIKIGGEKAWFTSVGEVVFNGSAYRKSQVEAAKTVLQFGGKIMVGCSHQYELTLDTVKKILSKL